MAVWIFGSKNTQTTAQPAKYIWNLRLLALLQVNLVLASDEIDATTSAPALDNALRLWMESQELRIACRMKCLTPSWRWRRQAWKSGCWRATKRRPPSTSVWPPGSSPPSKGSLRDPCFPQQTLSLKEISFMRSLFFTKVIQLTKRKLCFFCCGLIANWWKLFLAVSTPGASEEITHSGWPGEDFFSLQMSLRELSQFSSSGTSGLFRVSWYPMLQNQLYHTFLIGDTNQFCWLFL